MTLKSLTRPLRARYKLWRDRRFLKQHGCFNWRQYYRIYDPDVVHRACEIKNFYQGYPFVYCFEDRRHPAYRYYTGADRVDNWCTANLKQKFRLDMHRVIRNHWGEWEINELGGGDHWFLAFKSEQDYFLFLLRW